MVRWTMISEAPPADRRDVGVVARESMLVVWAD